ncbi:MAG: amidohydrolase [Gammaproteobacteria bacterium]|nr:amidohydrolase [Gammaproteobacteria bacterium]
METIIKQLLSDMIEIRHDIHANPELGFTQQRTGNVIAETLKHFGYHIDNLIDGKGVTALLDSGKPGKTVGLRADFDGLPIVEQGDLAYISTQVGKMHACGHDGHTANLLCVAGLLAQMTDQFSGKVKFIFQPAEELGAGAKVMIENGVLNEPHVDAIFGLHNWPGLPVGHIAVRENVFMAGITNFDITLDGKGGHSSTPHMCTDPILLAAQLINNLQSIISRAIAADDFAVLSITRVHGGDAYNIIPDQVVIGGSMRFIHDSTQEKMLSLIRQHSAAAAQSIGASSKVEMVQHVPPTVNSAAEAQQVYQTAVNCLGESQVSWLPQPVPATEDFAYFLQQRPGSYFFVGNGEQSENLHTTKYDFNDKALPNAAKVLSQIAIDYLNQEST